MSGFRQPEQPRAQLVLWSQRLDDAVPEDHPVRLFDQLLHSSAFAETFAELERKYVQVEGQPGYHPRDLAGLYLYGMLHRIRSSRQLETACHNRIDVIWLMHGQKPDHSTIAGFIKKHSKKLRQLFRDAVSVAQRAGLVFLKHVAIDGSKVEGDAGRGSVFQESEIEARLQAVNEFIEAVEAEWAQNERREKDLFGEKQPWNSEGQTLEQRLSKVKRQQELLEEALSVIERRRQESAGSRSPKAVASITDPDARVMKDKEGRSKPNFNSQIAVDEAQGVIVGADVNDRPDDSGQLTPMVEQVIDHCGKPPAAVSADSAYNTGPELAAMDAKGIPSFIPDSSENSEAVPLDKPVREALEAVRQQQELTPEQWAALPRNQYGYLDKSSFAYEQEQDQYRCPAGYKLPVLRTSRDKKAWGIAVRKQYGGCEACATCAHANMCCKDPQKGRTINRDQHEEHRERQRLRMGTPAGRAIYDRRKHIVEPRFGLTKHVLGVRRFMHRGLEMVRTEWQLVCAAVNIGILLRNWEKVSAIL